MYIHLKSFIVTFIVFILIDLTWLGFVAKNLYASYVGPMMRAQPNMVAAVIFYVLYVIGILAFVIYPHRGESLWTIALWGALFGLIAYATFDLTALAVLKGWSVPLTFIDLAWGTILTASVAAASSYILSR